MENADDTNTGSGHSGTRQPTTRSCRTSSSRSLPLPGECRLIRSATGLIVPAPDEAEPVIDDRTTTEIDPTQDFLISLGVTDDSRVSTVSVELRNDIDENAQTVNLLHAGEDAYEHAVRSRGPHGQRLVRVHDHGQRRHPRGDHRDPAGERRRFRLRAGAAQRRRRRPRRRHRHRVGERRRLPLAARPDDRRHRCRHLPVARERAAVRVRDLADRFLLPQRGAHRRGGAAHLRRGHLRARPRRSRFRCRSAHR